MYILGNNFFSGLGNMIYFMDNWLLAIDFHTDIANEVSYALFSD